MSNLSCTQILRNIARWRIFKNFTQEQVADFLRIRKRQYVNIENGISSLSLERLIYIASFLQIDIVSLLTLHILEEKGQFPPPPPC
jgi:transcriptional regulator with XRE-family HTH domain